jgi:hypothetical protein
MNYTPPNTVTSPRDYISNLCVLFDGGEDSVSVARLHWEGKPCIAMRWNVARREWDDPEKKSGKKVCVGMPSSHGFPVWFLLPDELLEEESDLRRLVKASYEASA